MERKSKRQARSRGRRTRVERKRRHGGRRPRAACPRQSPIAGDCGGPYTISLDASGREVCRDACGNSVPKFKCFSMELEPGSKDVTFRVDPNCKLSDDMRGEIERRLSDGEIVIDRRQK